MDILIIGGHGAVSRFAVEELIQGNHNVTVFDIEDNQAYKADHDYDFVQGDFTSEDNIRQAVEQTDAVLNLAALKRPAFNENPKLVQEVNIGGAVNVFEAAADLDVRVIHMSSKSVFSHICGKYAYPLYKPLDEGAPKYTTGDIYGLPKAATEAYMQYYTDDNEHACKS